MKEAGQIVAFQFPETSLQPGKIRPALLLGKLPGPYEDWLLCMISSQTRQAVAGFDEIVQTTDPDYSSSGLKTTSVIRIGRVAVVEGTMLLGAVGAVSTERLDRVRHRLADWLLNPSR